MTKANQTEDVSGQSPAHPAFGAARRMVDRITLFLNVIGTLLIVAVMVLVNADVIGRGAFNSPISGVPEIVSMSIVAIVFLQVGQAFRMGRLTRSDAILNIVGKRSPRAKAAMEFLFCAGALLIMIQVFLASVPLFEKAWVRNTFEGTIGDFTAPIWPVKLIILIGCAVLIIQLMISAIIAANDLIRPPLADNHGSTGGAP